MKSNEKRKKKTMILKNFLQKSVAKGVFRSSEVVSNEVYKQYFFLFHKVVAVFFIPSSSKVCALLVK